VRYVRGDERVQLRDVDHVRNMGAVMNEDNNSTLKSKRDIDFGKLMLRQGRFWTWTLNPNQSYLGRTIIALNRNFHGSFSGLRQSEWSELQIEIKQFEKLISECFEPDRFNYTQMGNIWEQLHVHAIPRYRSARDWSGVEFCDERWGKNSAPTPNSPISMGKTYELADWVRSQILTIEEKSTPVSIRNVM
jgi:diadenosine tetraphosphate (Ap4A) HIT family hydrolase